MSENTPRWGMATFLMVAFGQVISVTGSALTGFAMSVWVYQETHSTILFSLILLFTVLPSLLLAPLAGVLADHWDRRIVMIASDGGAALCTGLLLLLISLGNLQIWQIYLIMGVNSLMRGLQAPAYLASVSVLVPKDQLGRANGVLQMESTASYLLSPFVAGWMLDRIGIIGVLGVDLVTFMFAISALLWVRFPKSKLEEWDQDGIRSYWQETLSGWRFISTRSGFMGLVALFALGNYANIMTDTVMPPMLLEFASPTMVGGVLSTGGLGMLVGTLIMSAWGGPKRRVLGVVAFKGLAGLAVMVIGLSRSVEWIALATFFYFLPFPLVNGTDQAIWQSKVPLHMQGRVFATRRMIAHSMIPIAYLTAGPLSDMIFKPLLAQNGRLSLVLGQYFGIGPGRGIGLLIFLMGLWIVVLSLSAAFNPRVWNIEAEQDDVI
jgi:DHA3 family macrolide efflux protein-like MFS transporter